MASRPNYFEGRAERLLVVERDGGIEWHPLDEAEFQRMNALSRSIRDSLAKSNFARIQDLSLDQRKALFQIVLGKDTVAYKKLADLLKRFQNLGSMSQRAVIARLLTTVAETLAYEKEIVTLDGFPLLPDDLETINEAKIFEIVMHNLLHRDMSVGTLAAAKRQFFLRSFALYLQRPGRDAFASPEEMRSLVQKIFSEDLKRTDAPEQLLENYYRTCRRHSGLTTEGQFRDTSGMIDMPVEEHDTDSRVGFSHNSLREYVVAEAIADFVEKGSPYHYMNRLIVSDLVGDFLVSMSEFRPTLTEKLSERYKTAQDYQLREMMFKVIYFFIRKDRNAYIDLLGRPATIVSTDISAIDLSGLSLKDAVFRDCVALDTDFRKSDLRGAFFERSILDGIMLDDAVITGADFTTSEVISLYVYDRFDTDTTTILKGKPARQWLFSRGARVSPCDDLNPLMGKPWYEAAREVTRTLEHRIAGSHQDVSLSKGTPTEYREFVKEFVEFLTAKGILIKGKKSKRGPGYILTVNPDKRQVIHDFSRDGKISGEIQRFFDKFIPKEPSNCRV